ncbi:tetratricopeptide repeat protein [Roseomonas marmotae]|uniref:Methyltransferase domain-containing protein n=1 Tax=Roseomonas marmotae TaxID=2768161 RepID=A0ABS3K839_9PROT|nr:tetratricopeptide repeat protein [Roseomonas marmotae]MBO1073172.1 methyltransferase domain-containing protein [Roseomonas marmotae]QTI79194.1 methyltransferase domain-containing protein [Roseomonas marmotae]
MTTGPDPDALLRQGLARHQAGDLAGARQFYRQALALRPRDGNALNLLGQIARARGDLPEALRLIGQAVALHPGAPVFLAAQGATLAEAGRLPEAEAALRAALAARPQDATSLRNLGQVLSTAGRVGEALAPLRQAVALLPGSGEAHLALAHACREAGLPEEAATHAARAAAHPRLAEQARFLLAALGAASPPARAPASYVRDLFDQYAPRFDADLTGRLGYRTPAMLAELLLEAGVAADGSRAVLDLGCGTGLSGQAVAPFARRLEGLDLSPRMLAEARARGIYHALHEADLLDFLPRQPGAWDLVVAADVLNYLGDLSPVLAAIGHALVPGGIAAFSLEKGEKAPCSLGPDLRYRHHPAALRALAGSAGLTVLAEREAALRREKGAPVDGLLWVLRRA